MTMKKTYVLDTNVLLHNAACIESFADNVVVIPMAVIEELDKFKSRSDELGRNARSVIRRIDELRASGSLDDGAPIEGGGTLKIVIGQGDFKESGLDLEVEDNRILRAGYGLHRSGETVIFVSKDINARLKADALGMTAVDFDKQKVNFDELYTGYRKQSVPAATVDDFYKTEILNVPGNRFFPNEFVLLSDETKPKHSALARAVDAENLRHLSSHYERAWSIKPRNKEQRLALELLMDPNVKIVTLVGQAGTGKTLLALAASLDATLRHDRYEKILVSRPIIPLGKDIGYLPGAKDAKLGQWMLPIFDNLAFLMAGKDRNGSNGNGSKSTQKKVDALLNDGTVELEALTYIRGRSISNQYVIVDEAQNLTPHEVKTIVSRAGDGTKIVLTGDPYQIDSPYLDSSSNGLTYSVERLKGQTLHGHITLKKSERSELSAIAAERL